MKISEQWLRQWVAPEITTEELAAQLTMAGLEVDSVEKMAPELKKVVVGHVESLEQHPNADRLRVCQVNVGLEEPLQIICGAHNFSAGANVVVAMHGAVLPGKIKIKKSKLRGVLSQGMICSAKELDMGDETDGIWVLPHDAPVGEALVSYLNLNDNVIDVDLTPNRGDCLSIRGVAREIAAFNKNTPLNGPALSPQESNISATFPVTLTANTACPHYVGRVIKNINSKANSPMWLQEKLRRSGLRSIDPVVDVTNYVLLELGQPLHAFDFDFLQDGIDVRYAKAGEALTLLDGRTIECRTDDLVIADSQQALALAGIMGGQASAVNDETTAIFLESAFFTPDYMAGKARHHNLHTDSSHRFERGVDPQLQTIAIERATELLLDIVGGDVGEIIEVTASEHMPRNQEIKLVGEHVSRLLGITLSANDITDYLTRLNFEIIDQHDSQWRVRAPSYRFDCQIEEDVIEEMARLYGYHNIPAQAPEAALSCHRQAEGKRSLSAIRQLLMNRGYQEVITYSFVDDKLLNILKPTLEVVKLQNPLAQDMNVMRTSLWPGMLQAVQYNQHRQQSQGMFFEIGQRYYHQQDETVQQSMLAGVVYGDVWPEQWNNQRGERDFYDIKADIECLLASSDGNISFHCDSNEPALHPGQCAQIRKNNEVIGTVGALHPQVLQQLSLRAPVFLFELDLNAVQCVQTPVYKTISKFPAIRRDIAILVEREVSGAVICDKIVEVAGPWLQDIKLFDVYRGQGIDSRHKSLALGLILQHSDRTLVEEEINQVMATVIASLQDEFNATLRT